MCGDAHRDAISAVCCLEFQILAFGVTTLFAHYQPFGSTIFSAYERFVVHVTRRGVFEIDGRMNLMLISESLEFFINFPPIRKDCKSDVCFRNHVVISPLRVMSSTCVVESMSPLCRDTQKDSPDNVGNFRDCKTLRNLCCHSIMTFSCTVQSFLQYHQHVTSEFFRPCNKDFVIFFSFSASEKRMRCQESRLAMSVCFTHAHMILQIDI